MSTMYPSDLSDAEWECLQRHLPPTMTRRRRPPHPLRKVFDAIFYLLRTGCPWRYLPRDFPPWQTIYYHFRRFRLSDVWHRILIALRVPVSGRTRADVPDVKHPKLAIGAKSRQKLPRWLEQAVEQAEASAKDGQLPVAVLHQDGKKYRDALVVCRLSGFARFVEGEE